MDRGAWQAIVHGVAKDRTQLSDFHFTDSLKTFSVPQLQKHCFCFPVGKFLSNPWTFSGSHLLSSESPQPGWP